MAQLVASMSGVVLGGVVKVVGSNLARGKYLQHLSAQLIHFFPSVYIYTSTAVVHSREEGNGQESIQSSTTPGPGHHMGK